MSPVRSDKTHSLRQTFPIDTRYQRHSHEHGDVLTDDFISAGQARIAIHINNLTAFDNHVVEIHMLDTMNKGFGFFNAHTDDFRDSP